MVFLQLIFIAAQALIHATREEVIVIVIPSVQETSNVALIIVKGIFPTPKVIGLQEQIAALVSILDTSINYSVSRPFISLIISLNTCIFYPCKLYLLCSLRLCSIPRHDNLLYQNISYHYQNCIMQKTHSSHRLRLIPQIFQIRIPHSNDLLTRQ